MTDLSRRAFLGVLGGAALAACHSERRNQAARDPVRVHYLPSYTVSGYAFETTRKATWIADSLSARPIEGIRLTGHEPVTLDLLRRVHDPAYVDAVRTGDPRALAESQGFTWDPALWEMVCASNGGVVAGARAALEHGVSGALASGLHHAHRAHGAGFCTFNGLALAATALQLTSDARVLVLDLDAHCGGGTHELLGDNPAVRIADIAVNPFDTYPPRGANTLELVVRAEHYLPTLGARLRALDAERFDICLYNAGMDPHEDCMIGGLIGIDKAMLAERERMVFSWCRRRRIPIAFVVAGGYTSRLLDEPSLVDLHRLTLHAAAHNR